MTTPSPIARSLENLVSSTNRLLDVGETDTALRIIFGATRQIVERTLAVAHICGSRELDHLCLEIGRTAQLTSATRPGDRRLYLVSELYEFGGHTRLLEDMILAAPEAEHLIVWTVGEMHQPIVSQPDFFRTAEAKATQIRHLLGTPTERIRAGSELIAGYAPSTIVHLGHPNDPITLALLQPAEERRLLMIHHADSSFALGRYHPDVHHVSVGKLFQTVGRQLFGFEAAYLPLTLRHSIRRSSLEGVAEFATATSGGAYKFDLGVTPSYLDLLRVRMEAREGSHYHIGPLDELQRAAIARALEDRSAAARFVHLPEVRSLGQMLADRRISLYLDSYPIGGGIAIVEAMAAGVPICATMRSPYHSGSPFAYSGSMTWTDLADFDALLRGLDAGRLQEHAARSLDYFQAVHSFESFIEVLSELAGKVSAHVATKQSAGGVHDVQESDVR